MQEKITLKEGPQYLDQIVALTDTEGRGAIPGVVFLREARGCLP